MNSRAKTELQVHWEEGLKLVALDNSTEIKIGGRILSDWVWNNPDEGIEAAIGETYFRDGAEFRQARLHIAGHICENVIFCSEYDFAGAVVAFKDVYLGLRKIPFVGTIKIGHFKEPFGLEHHTSRKFMTFMERGLSDALVPSRNAGALVQNTAAENHVNFAVGVYRDVDDSGNGFANSRKYNATARLAVIPWYEKDEGVVHVGIAYSYRNPNEDKVRYESQQPVNTAANLVSTGDVSADKVNLVGGEGALVYGSVSLQAEYVLALVHTPGGENVTFDGFYVYGSYFLTGERRVYDTSVAAFNRMKPNKSFDVRRSGYGAWQIAARYSCVDLEDERIGVVGGRLNELTVGLNWYLNPNTRIMFNYVRADLDDVGIANFFQTRFQVDF